LTEIGILVKSIKIIPDQVDAIVDSIEQSFNTSDIILMTGGLGPTDDDLTRDAVAVAFNEEQYSSSELEEKIREYFRIRSIQMAESNIRQSMIIPSAEIIPNDVGTASGWWIEKDNKILVTMPGVPSELYEMWRNFVQNRLRRKALNQAIVIHTIKTFGRLESSIAEDVKHLFKSKNPVLGIYAKQDGVHLRIMGFDQSEHGASKLVRDFEQQILLILKSDIWGFDNDTLEQKLGDLLKNHKLKLSIMESCTGGLLSNTITSIEGSSEYFKAGIVSYSNESKILMGVDPKVIESYGVVSPQVAQQMANAVRIKFHTDIGIGVTGILGEKPIDGHDPGLVYINISSYSHSNNLIVNFKWTRSIMKRNTVSAILFRMLQFLPEFIEDNKLDTK
jgi:nicotinamide-nucleotide amidase